MNHQARRAATKPRLVGGVRRQIRAHVAERDGWWCHYCRVPFPTLHGVTLDHYIPHCLWAENRPRNLVLACDRCNQVKADYLPVTLAWLLLTRATNAGTFNERSQVFTVDPSVFMAVARWGIDRQSGRPAATPDRTGYTIAFTLALTASHTNQSPHGRRVVGTRAVAPTSTGGRPPTWKNPPTTTHLNTHPTAPNTPNPSGADSTDSTPHPSGADSPALNTDHTTVNTHPNPWGMAA